MYIQNSPKTFLFTYQKNQKYQKYSFSSFIYKVKRAVQHFIKPQGYIPHKQQKMEIFQIQEQDQKNSQLKEEAIDQGPIFSFLVSKVQKRFNDVTRAEVELNLKMEYAKRKEKATNHQQTSYTIELIDQKVIDDKFVLYEIKITKGSQAWIFQTRYSLLLNLHEQLPKKLKDLINVFPKKKFFGKFNKTFLDQRYRQLDSYLKSLFSQPEAFKNEDTRNFLRQSRKAAIQINDPTLVNSFILDF